MGLIGIDGSWRGGRGREGSIQDEVGDEGEGEEGKEGPGEQARIENRLGSSKGLGGEQEEGDTPSLPPSLSPTLLPPPAPSAVIPKPLPSSSVPWKSLSYTSSSSSLSRKRPFSLSALPRPLLPPSTSSSTSTSPPSSPGPSLARRRSLFDRDLRRQNASQCPAEESQVIGYGPS